MVKNNKGYKCNNKKNNDLCSALLKAAMQNEKELYLIPYATKKEKVNKTFHTIGDANGISYQNISTVNGNLIGDTYVNIIRDDDRKSINLKKSSKLTGSSGRKTLTKKRQINSDSNCFKEINIQDYNM